MRPDDASTWIDSWSGNWPLPPFVLPLPFHVEIGVRPVVCHVIPVLVTVPRFKSSWIWNGEVKLNAWQTKYAVLPSGLKATTGSPPASYAPVPGTSGLFVNFVTPGR